MNILLLAKKNPWPPKDGEAIAILQMAKGLAANGNKITILYMNTPKHHFDPEKINLLGFENISFICWVPWLILLKKHPTTQNDFLAKIF